MPELQSFSPPANINDFPDDPTSAALLRQYWDTNVRGWTAQAILGNPWSSTNASNQTAYYDPTVTNIPSGTAAVLIDWFAFPNRLSQYFGQTAVPTTPYQYTQQQIYALAATGYINGQNGTSFGLIPTQRCPMLSWSGYPPSDPNDPNFQIYGPYGPRGWQDEYCEWSVTRNAAGNIIQIHFACENPEYWNTLWSVSPERVAELYQATLNWGLPTALQITVTVEDLQLVDPTTQKPVIDPSTGRPAYNPLNKWNNSPISVRTGSPTDTGGVMHLTSTPNTLQTEMGLAGAATVQRTPPATNEQTLICCGKYGQNFRNSDPHIGGQVNGKVGQGNIISLADPVGLYIQQPTLLDSIFLPPSGHNVPANAPVSDCWHVVRGEVTLIDPVTNQNFPGSFILHAVFQIPEAWQTPGQPLLTVNDIHFTNGNPVQWGSELVSAIQIGLYGRPIAAAVPTAETCVGTPNVVYATPLQLTHQAVWDAYYATSEPNPAAQAMSMASNTTLIAPRVEQGATGVLMALTCDTITPGPQGQLPTVTFPGNDVTATVLGSSTVNYAVPGNSYPGAYTLLNLQLNVAANAQLGLQGVQVTNYGQSPQAAMPALLNIVAIGSINS